MIHLKNKLLAQQSDKTLPRYKNEELVDPDTDSRFSITSSTSTGTSHTLLTITNATTDTDGSYACEAVYQPDVDVKFTGGRVRSNPATLTVYSESN